MGAKDQLFGISLWKKGSIVELVAEEVTGDTP